MTPSTFEALANLADALIPENRRPKPYLCEYAAFGFAAGDANLFRYVRNNATNAMDPTGLFIVFATKKGATEFADKLKKDYGAKHVAIVEGTEAAYVLIDPRDRKAAFAYADQAFKDVFVQRFETNDAAKKVAAKRNQFLMAAGVGTSPDETWSDVNGNELPIKELDRLRISKYVKDNRLSATNPIHVDIGGEGGHADAINVNIGTVRGQKNIPMLIVRIGRDDDLPFESESVERVTMESTPISEATANAIARVMKPGGKIELMNPTPGAQTHHGRVIKAVGNKGIVKQVKKDIDGVEVMVTTIEIKK